MSAGETALKESLEELAPEMLPPFNMGEPFFFHLKSGVGTPVATTVKEAD